MPFLSYLAMPPGVIRASPYLNTATPRKWLIDCFPTNLLEKSPDRTREMIFQNLCPKNFPDV
jgi:hypothetical protein